MAVERTNLDLYLIQVGSKNELYPASVKALKEFEALVPHKIDRYADQIMPIQHVCGPCFGLTRSNKSWEERRGVIMKIVGINFASQYISMMIKNTDDWAKQLPIGEEIDLSFEISKLTFGITISFKDELNSKISKPVIY